MSLGERIKENRKRVGLSQEKMAERMGVSRQAVTKWESGQSAPSTENLFKLAEILGTRVDLLLATEPEKPEAAEERVLGLHPRDLDEKRMARLERWRNHLALTLSVIAGYAAVYLLGRIFCTREYPMSILGWLFGYSPQQHTYLYGWLMHRKLFWLGMTISLIPALLGKGCYAFTTLFGFSAGLILGECFGQNPAGAPYGQGHYGWAIWGVIFLFSMVMGAVLEKNSGERLDVRSRKFWIWTAVFAAGILLIVLGIRMGMPTFFG